MHEVQKVPVPTFIGQVPQINNLLAGSYTICFLFRAPIDLACCLQDMCAECGADLRKLDNNSGKWKA